MQKYETEKQAASHQFNRVRQEQLQKMENKLKLRKKRRRVKKQREHEAERRRIRVDEEARIQRAEEDAAAVQKIVVKKRWMKVRAAARFGGAAALATKKAHEAAHEATVVAHESLSSIERAVSVFLFFVPLSVLLFCMRILLTT